MQQGGKNNGMKKKKEFQFFIATANKIKPPHTATNPPPHHTATHHVLSALLFLLQLPSANRGFDVNLEIRVDLLLVLQPVTTTLAVENKHIANKFPT